jgi:hypothetical protein
MVKLSKISKILKMLILFSIPHILFGQCDKVYNFVTRKPKFNVVDDSLSYYNYNYISRFILKYYSNHRPCPARIAFRVNLLVNKNGIVEEFILKDCNIIIDEELLSLIRGIYINKKIFIPAKYFTKSVCSNYKISFLLIPK